MTRTGRFEMEPVDTRLALRTYAGVVGLTGFVLAGWGQIWLGSDLAGLPWGRAALIRVAGAAIVAAAVMAWGLSSAGARARRQLFSWFVAAHVVVWAMLAMQGAALDIGILRQLSWLLLAVILGLLYVRFSFAERRPGDRPLSVSRVQARDAESPTPEEQQIRDAAAQEERNRLARELHDAVKQQIFAIQTSAATAEARFARDPGGTRQAIAQVRQSAREAMCEMEAMLEQLRAAPLGRTGLVEAIRKQTEALAFRTGASIDLRVGTLPPDGALAPGAHQAIYRVVQEALANIGRHARAQHVRLSIETTPLEIEIQVEDDGVGFEGEATTGMGIQNMRARAAEIGGTIRIGTCERGGTRVVLSVPYETLDARDYRRRHVLLLSLVFGSVTASGLFSVFERGLWLGNVFVVFFGLAFVQHIRIWLRLRRVSAAGPHTASPR